MPTGPGFPQRDFAQRYSDRMRALSRLSAATAAAGIVLLAACSGANDEPANVQTPASTQAASSVTAFPRLTTTTPPTPAPTTRPVPAVGDFCIGANIGKKAVDAQGRAIVCDNYQWKLDTGQTARNPWGDQQREWTECTQTHTEAECREQSHWGNQTTPTP